MASPNRKRLAARLALWASLLGTALVIGCTQQGASNIAAPLASPQPTGTPQHPFLEEWGFYGNANGDFDHPSALAVNNAGTTVYVADENNNRVEAFSPAGTYLTQWPATLPTGLAVEAGGDVVVTTQEYVQRFDYAGNLLASGGGPGAGAGQFSGPQGLADPAGVTVYVADSANQRVQAVTFLGGASTPSYGVTALASWGAGTGGVSFGSPFGLALSPSHTVLYVTDNGNSAAWGVSLGLGGGVFAWGGGFGPSSGQFSHPQGLAVDPTTGHPYVADTGNNRIEEFAPNGSFLFQWGGTGAGNGFFHSPTAIAVDGNGVIYVVDSGNELIQKFGP